MPASDNFHAPKPVGRDHILVIDDDPLFRSLMVTILRRDYSVAVASDGAEGFYLALEHMPTLATIDIMMPGWDGLRTLQAFRSHPLLQAVPVILLTSDASRETVMAAIHGGADEYLVKTSFNRELLLEKVRRLIDRGVRKTVAESPAPPTPMAAFPASTPDRSLQVADVAAKVDEETRLQAMLDGWE